MHLGKIGLYKFFIYFFILVPIQFANAPFDIVTTKYFVVFLIFKSRFWTSQTKGNDCDLTHRKGRELVNKKFLSVYLKRKNM